MSLFPFVEPTDGRVILHGNVNDDDFTTVVKISKDTVQITSIVFDESVHPLDKNPHVTTDFIHIDQFPDRAVLMDISDEYVKLFLNQ